MERLYLLKLGELTLKGDNQRSFMNQLKWDLKRRLEGVPNRIDIRDGRFFLDVPESAAARTEEVLSNIPGLAGFARALGVQKEIGAVVEAAATLVAQTAIPSGRRRFKVEARRADKSFPLDSYGLCCALGDALCERFPELIVDVREPEFTVNAEIRDKAFVYVDQSKGQRGLPVGSSGKGMLLLSGGIDSPVAGYLMALRGLSIEAIHFHSYPYTSKEALEKVRDLARTMARFTGPVPLHVVPFTDVQIRIKEKAEPNVTTLFLRAAMMTAADILAKRRGCGSLVTGESLGQVASQTQESIRFSQSFSDLPVMRPLIGMDKHYAMDTARRIGTYEISIRPFEDCCVLFSPKHPLLNPDLAAERLAWAAVEAGPLIEEALSKTEFSVIREGAGR